MLRLIVVDDEAPARRYLRRLLEAHGDVSVVGEAATRDEAVRLIRAHVPDALFLDIELMRGTGFDVLAELEHRPSVVFVTAHADHAVRAFSVAATDYLLKPVGAKRLAETLERLRQTGTIRARHDDHGTGAVQADAPMPHPAPQTCLVARTRHGIRQVKMNALSAAVAQGDYVRLHCADGSIELIHATLSGLLPQLPSPPFFQASRSIIVNLEHVVRVSGGENRSVAFITLAAPIELGVTAFARLRRQLASAGRPPSRADRGLARA